MYFSYLSLLGNFFFRFSLPLIFTIPRELCITILYTLTLIFQDVTIFIYLDLSCVLNWSLVLTSVF